MRPHTTVARRAPRRARRVDGDIRRHEIGSPAARRGRIGEHHVAANGRAAEPGVGVDAVAWAKIIQHTPVK